MNACKGIAWVKQNLAGLIGEGRHCFIPMFGMIGAIVNENNSIFRSYPRRTRFNQE